MYTRNILINYCEAFSNLIPSSCFSTFNESNAYQNLEKGPIIEDTILVLDPHVGSVLHSWGAYAFYMPHGLTVDRHDNVWVTDVAKHQVFKVTPIFFILSYGKKIISRSEFLTHLV